MSNPSHSTSLPPGMNDILMSLYIEPDMPGIDDLVITVIRLRRGGRIASELTSRILSSAAYQAIPPEAFTDPERHPLKEYVNLSRELGLINGTRHNVHLCGVIRREIISGTDRAEIICRVLFSLHYSEHEENNQFGSLPCSP